MMISHSLYVLTVSLGPILVQRPVLDFSLWHIEGRGVYGETHSANIGPTDDYHILQGFPNARHCMYRMMYYRLLCL